MGDAHALKPMPTEAAASVPPRKARRETWLLGCPGIRGDGSEVLLIGHPSATVREQISRVGSRATKHHGGRVTTSTSAQCAPLSTASTFHLPKGFVNEAKEPFNTGRPRLGSGSLKSSG